jgi:hypothetical protein
MKKRSVFVAVLLALMIMLISTTAAGAESKRLALVNAVSRGGDQTVFTFIIYGEFKSFNGKAFWSGQAFDLDCKPKGNKPDVLLCRGHQELAGKFVQVVVNGFSFDTYVTAIEEISPSIPLCNPVYDDAGYGSPMPESWEYYGDYCTPSPPNFGDTAILTGYYPGTWTYIFMPNGSCPGVNGYGLGWYYGFCYY